MPSVQKLDHFVLVTFLFLVVLILLIAIVAIGAIVAVTIRLVLAVIIPVATKQDCDGRVAVLLDEVANDVADALVVHSTFSLSAHLIHSRVGKRCD